MKLAGFLILSCLSIQSAFAEDSKTLARLPRVGDETSVAKIIANPGQYLNKPLVVCGSVTVKNYYNYGYRDSGKTHYSLGFTEVTENLRPIGDLTGYVRRDIAESMVAAILKNQQQGFSGTAGRFKVMVTDRSFSLDGHFGEVVEILAWQFRKPDGSGWRDWTPEAAIAQPDRKAEAAQTARQGGQTTLAEGEARAQAQARKQTLLEQQQREQAERDTVRQAQRECEQARAAGTLLQLGANVDQVLEDGLLVSNIYTDPGVPGIGANHFRSSSWVITGYPVQDGIAEGNWARCMAYRKGTYAFKTVLGASRTLERWVYCGPVQKNWP